MKKFILDYAGNPRGWIGKFLLKTMDLGHVSLIDWTMGILDIKESDIILDIGCGSGKAIEMMALKAQKVYGIDRADLSIQQSRERNSQKIQEGKVEIIKMDVDDLSFSPASFDLITAFATISFWENLDKNLKDIYELLTPNGRFVVIGENVLRYSYDDLKEFMERANFKRIQYYSNDKEKLMIGFK